MNSNYATNKCRKDWNTFRSYNTAIKVNKAFDFKYFILIFGVYLKIGFRILANNLV